MPPLRPAGSLRRAGNGLLDAAFLLLCLRFQHAALAESQQPGPSAVLLAVGLLLGWLQAEGGLFALGAAVPLLTGLSQMGLVASAAPTSLVFSGLFVGDALRRALRRDPRLPEGAPASAPDSIAGALAFLVLVSLGIQLWRHRHDPSLPSALWRASGFGVSHPLSFLSASFLWLQGLFYFRLLRRSVAGAGSWLPAIFVAWAMSLAVFLVLQFASGVPDAYNGYVYFLPFEDISSFGSAAVCVFAFALAGAGPGFGRRRGTRALALSVLFALLVASWSRAAWLAALSTSLIAAWTLWPRKYRAALAVAILSAVVVATSLSSQTEADAPPYAWRLIRLLKIENPVKKDPTRVELYFKALRIIREHPIFGRGIGSFYGDSVLYARPGDPYGNVPDHAHDALLQVAAELGLPAALALLALAVLALRSGFRSFARDPSDRVPLGAALAFLACAQTHVTGVSLNIYVSNQFMFWLLAAALLPKAAPAREPASAGQD